MLNVNIYINNKFKNLIWFQNVFYNNNIVACYRYKESKTSILVNQMLLATFGTSLKFKFFNASCNLKNIKYFSFLTGPLCVIYSNDLERVIKFHVDGFYLFAVSYCGYYINCSYFKDLYNFYLFYNYNFLFISSHLTWFVITLNSFLIMIIATILSKVNLVYNYFLGVHKILLLSLKSKKNNL